MVPRMGRRGLFRSSLSLLLLLGFAAGCLHRQLEFTARRTLNTLPDLQYQQVMDNLAAIASESGASALSCGCGPGCDPGHGQRHDDVGLEHPDQFVDVGRARLRRLSQRHRHVEPGHDHQPGQDPRNAGGLPARGSGVGGRKRCLHVVECRRQARRSCRCFVCRPLRRCLGLGDGRRNRRPVRPDARDSRHRHARRHCTASEPARPWLAARNCPAAQLPASRDWAGVYPGRG